MRSRDYDKSIRQTTRNLLLNIKIYTVVYIAHDKIGDDTVTGIKKVKEKK